MRCRTDAVAVCILLMAGTTARSGTIRTIDGKNYEGDVRLEEGQVVVTPKRSAAVKLEQARPQPNPGGIRVQPVVGGGVGQVLPPALQQRLNLTDEQKKQIDAIQKEVEAKILKVLTDDQKKQFEELKKGGLQPRIRPIQPNPAIQNSPALVPVQPANLPARKQ